MKLSENRRIRTTVGDLVVSLTEEIEKLPRLKTNERALLVAYIVNDVLARRWSADRVFGWNRD